MKEGIDKLLKVGFIMPIDKATWLSPIVIMPKKNEEIRVCLDYKKLNATTIFDPFPFPFIDTLLDALAKHDIYNFLDGLGCNQIKIALKDEKKIVFITKWG